MQFGADVCCRSWESMAPELTQAYSSDPDSLDQIDVSQSWICLPAATESSGPHLQPTES